jgi:hypothetical protein
MTPLDPPLPPYRDPDPAIVGVTEAGVLTPPQNALIRSAP